MKRRSAGTRSLSTQNVGIRSLVCCRTAAGPSRSVISCVMVGTSIIRGQAPSARRLSAATAASGRAWTVEAPELSLGNPPPSSADALLFRQLFATTVVLQGKLRAAAGNQAHKHPPEE